MPRFARTSEYQLLFERGWPHLYQLRSPHPHEKDAEKWATRALDDFDPTSYHVDWPREVAYRFVRTLPHVGAHGIGFKQHLSSLPAAQKALASAGPVEEEEGRALLAALVDPAVSAREWQFERALFLIEAMIGSEAAADALLERFETMPTRTWTEDPAGEISYHLGFVVRRLAPAVRARAEKRIAALVRQKPPSTLREFLSYIIGGRKALEDSGRTLGLYCVHFADDPGLLCELAQESCKRIDGHHVWLAGDAMLDALLANLTIWPWRQPQLIDELTPIASPKVDEILAALGKKKKLAKQAQAALEARKARR